MRSIINSQAILALMRPGKAKLFPLFITMLFLFFGPQLSAQTKPPAAMTNANIIKLHKAGLDDEIILSRIESSTCKFDVLDDGLIALKKEGVSDRVIKAMMDKAQGKKAAPTPAVAETKTDKAVPSSRSTIAEPSIMNAVFTYEKIGGNLKALDKINATQKVHKAGMGFGATSYTCEIPGDKSALRLKTDDPQSFVINTGGPTPDAYILFKVEVNKSKRIATTSKITGMGSMKGAQGNIACNVRQLKPGVFEITPTSKLDKGEYFFTTRLIDYTTMGNMDVYAFGID